jgi:hypothetical protein
MGGQDGHFHGPCGLQSAGPDCAFLGDDLSLRPRPKAQACGRAGSGARPAGGPAEKTVEDRQ